MQPYERHAEKLALLGMIPTSIDEPKPSIEKPTFYEKEKVETSILMAGTTKLTESFIDTIRKHFVFKGNEKFANAKIYGTVTIYQPDTIFDYPSQRFSIEKKIVGDREFWRVWFSPSEYEIMTTFLADVVKNWCQFRHISLECDTTQEILKSCS